MSPTFGQTTTKTVMGALMISEMNIQKVLCIYAAIRMVRLQAARSRSTGPKRKVEDAV